jgi:predicted molibdopterin-dependent oxidoreductase YjgC
MSDPLYRDYERLVELKIMGKPFKVPEKNTVLRALQYVSPETIPYGRFCWNQECQLCKIGCRTSSQADAQTRQVLACKLIVADGLEISELSDELKWTLAAVLKPAEPRPPYE